MSGGKKRDSFILQAGILAAAGFISRIIGLLYVSPVTRIIGHVGLGYYQSAYNYYAIVLMISSYSIPSAISKVIAQKLSLREYRNAHRVFICAMYYVLGVGLVASLLLFFGAGHLVPESAV
ncbi:MAG: oligosaccharide flippase family protein, partial [Lachnospiraceae bacterium]|nr:oligosaccharide flippase family protein [Lachnospiraceae bacterium]